MLPHGDRLTVFGDITTQHKTPDWLMVLFSGDVNVIRNGQNTGKLTVPCFIGERAYISGAPASATLIVVGEADVHYWSTERLAEIETEDPELSRALRSGIALDLVVKLHQRPAADESS